VDAGSRLVWPDIIAALLATFTTFGFCLVAWHNVRTGRIDARGARSILVVTFAAFLSGWLLSASHAPTSWEFTAFVEAIAMSGFGAGILCLAYVAIEPYVRRNWPDALISWTRLQTGRLRDPLVASHVLAGIAVVMSVIRLQQLLVILWDDRLIARSNDLFLGSPGDFASMLLDRAVEQPLLTGMALVLQVVVLRLLLRRLWLADLAALAMWAGAAAGEGLLSMIAAVTFPLPGLWLLRRYGLLAMFAGLSAYHVTMVPFSLTSWYATRALVANAIPVVIAAWALWVVLSSRRAIFEEPL
jgi:hypothetical protein